MSFAEAVMWRELPPSRRHYRSRRAVPFSKRSSNEPAGQLPL